MITPHLALRTLLLEEMSIRLINNYLIEILIWHFLNRKGNFWKEFRGVMLWDQFSNDAKLAETILSFKKLIRKSVGLDKMYIFIVTVVYFYWIIIIIVIHTTSKGNFSISLMI